MSWRTARSTQPTIVAARGRRRLRDLAVVVALVMVATSCAWVVRASVGPSAEQGDGGSFEPSISADGRYVAFSSEASNLVIGDTNDAGDIFRRDLAAGTTTRVSKASDDNQANGGSFGPSISGDGRYVAFTSSASNLVADDTNAAWDVFLRDLVAGTTTRVSVDFAGNQANGRSFGASLSDDGRYVAFTSDASNLVPDDTNAARDVFVRDLVAGTTTRVSVDSDGNQANGGSSALGTPVSADGRFIAFSSDASNLVPDDTNAAADVFVRDTVASTTIRISVDSDGNETGGATGTTAVSADGRYIAFEAGASDLIPEIPPFSCCFIVVRDVVAGTTTLVNGDVAAEEGWAPSISADGRYIAFASNDGFEFDGVYVRDTIAGTTALISEVPCGDCVLTAMSADGRYVAFNTDSDAVVPDDTNVVDDVFVHAHPQPTIVAATPSSVARSSTFAGETTTVTVTGTSFIDTPFVHVRGEGVIVSDVDVLDETRLTIDVTALANAAVGTRDIILTLPGTGPGPHTGATAICTGCITITSD